MPAEYIKAPRRLWLLLLIALVGIGFSVELTKHYYEVRSGAAEFSSYCNIGKKMNCDVVAASTYADLIPGFPLSAFVVGWFLSLFFVVLIARNAFWRREALRVGLLLAVVGAGLSLFYLLVMMFNLKTYCLFCLFVDVLTFSSLGLILSLKPESIKVHRPDLPKWRSLGLVIVFSIGASVIGLKMLDGGSLDVASIDSQVKEAINAAPVSVQSGEGFPSLGPGNAPITIIEFSDFQCPFCRMGAMTLNTVLNRYPDQVKVVFRNFPLDPKCNRGVEASVHPYACEAARIAWCGYRQGKFKQVYETLFAKQASFGTVGVTKLALEAGVDEKQLTECLSASDTEMAIARDTNEGIALGIQSTPTFFVNGRKVEGVKTPAVWNQIIEHLPR